MTCSGHHANLGIYDVSATTQVPGYKSGILYSSRAIFVWKFFGNFRTVHLLQEAPQIGHTRTYKNQNLNAWIFR